MLAMNLPRNLISDSTLVDETLALLAANDGRASFKQISEAIFRLSNIDAELAAAMVLDLVENDPRFVIDAEHLRISEDPTASVLLRELDFVVLDVEAVHGRGIPARIIELGAFRGEGFALARRDGPSGGSGARGTRLLGASGCLAVLFAESLLGGHGCSPDAGRLC